MNITSAVSPRCVSLIVLILVVTTFCESSKLRAAAQDDLGHHADCPLRCQNLKADKLPGARVFYLIVVHNNRTLHDALHLVRAVRDPRNVLAIHVDRKAHKLIDSNNSILHRELKHCSCGSQFLIHAEYDVKWSEWSMNLTTLWGMKVAVQQYANQWDVFINLSGDTLPVFTTNVMADILHELPYNFVTSSSCETGLRPTNVYMFPSFWHKRAHYTQHDELPDPTFEYQDNESAWHKLTLQTYFGSQWMILQPQFCTWIVEELEKPKSLPSQYRDYLIQHNFLMTDETFFPSLLEQVSIFQHTLPAVDPDNYLLWKNQTASFISSVRFERMDEHSPSAFGYYSMQQRYQVPNTSIDIQLVEQTRPWGPYFLGVYDLASIRASGALFVRKVSTLVDHNLVHLLPVNHSSEIPNIAWPEEVSISDKPDWEKRIRASILAKQQQQAEQEEEEETIEPEEDDEEL